MFEEVRAEDGLKSSSQSIEECKFNLKSSDDGQRPLHLIQFILIVIRSTGLFSFQFHSVEWRRWSALYRAVLYCTVLYCTVLYSNVAYYSDMCST